ncbi:MAG: alpha/beta fold hydrolase [Gemmatimonadales bacterium]
MASLRKQMQLLALRAAFQTAGRAAPGQAARVAERIFCRPPAARPRPSEAEFLATGTPLSFKTCAGTLAGWSWGAGPVALLVHGWGSRAARFRVLAPALVSAGMRVVAYDGPGHGLSPGTETNLPEYATVLQEVTEQLGPLEAVAGHSLGGAAIAVALFRGLTIRRAVLIAPFGAAADFVDRFAELIGLPAAAQQQMVVNLERRLGFHFSDFIIADLVKQLSTPVLVIHDRDDEDIPLAEGEAIAAAWPGARFHRTAGLGHHAIMRDAETARLVARFMSERGGIGG